MKANGHFPKILLLIIEEHHSRSNLGLKEDEDEDEQCRHTGAGHHPNGERLLFSHGVDEPASDFGVGHFNAFWHNQFLQGVRVFIQNNSNGGSTLTFL